MAHQASCAASQGTGGQGHGCSAQGAGDWWAVSTTKFDVTLTFELAMQKYFDGDPHAGNRLFAQLGEQTRSFCGVPDARRREQVDGGGLPKIFKGTLVEVPSDPRAQLGKIDFPNFPRTIPVRRRELQ